MKKAILYGPGDLRIEETEMPQDKLGPDDVRIKTCITAFKSGTDRGNWQGAEQFPGAPDYPRHVGDSNLGVVIDAGSAVQRFAAGDRVITRQPHQSEFIINQHKNIVKVPETVDSEDAVFANLFDLSAHCYRRAGFQPGENVAVVGLGVLGLGAIAVGKCFGARTIGIANSQLRIDKAYDIGAHASFLYDDPEIHQKLYQATAGEGIDMVILAANPWPAYRTALEIVRPNGRVAIVSLVGRGEEPCDFNPLAMDTFYIKGITLISVWAGARPAGSYDYPYFVQKKHGSVAEDRFTARNTVFHLLTLMEAKLLEPKRLVTHRFHYTEMVRAYEMAARREKSMVGVIFQWDKINTC
jgi:threonine dehydrogenase-like Zn-dependent dehydrogenase